MATQKQDIPRDSGGYGYTLGTWYDSTTVILLLIMQPTKRSSQWVEDIKILDFWNGTVLVKTKTSTEYIYYNVSKRAITNLCFNDRMSLGFWVNENCIKPERTNFTYFAGGYNV